MKLELLNHSQLKIVLEKEDIKKWNIDFESLNYKDKKTKICFFTL
jgi:negative regulator of genetic competence, sporulation and motility